MPIAKTEQEIVLPTVDACTHAAICTRTNEVLDRVAIIPGAGNRYISPSGKQYPNGMRYRVVPLGEVEQAISNTLKLGRITASAVFDAATTGLPITPRPGISARTVPVPPAMVKEVTDADVVVELSVRENDVDVRRYVVVPDVITLRAWREVDAFKEG